MALEIGTIVLSTKILYGIALSFIKIFAMFFPGVFLIFIVVYPYLRHKGISYAIDKEKIIIFSGIIKRSREIVPIKNIEHLELSALPFEKIFSLATVKIYTSGSQHLLPSIFVEDAKYIQSKVYQDIL